MDIFTKIQPLLDAIERIAGKDAVASEFDTEDWSEVPLAIRERAIFSATVNNLRIVEDIQAKLKQAVSMQSDAGGIMSKSRFIADMRETMGALGSESTQLTDITSRRRLALIYDFQRKDAGSYANWKANNNPVLLDEFPAQELIRDEHRQVPRNWEERWSFAGGKFYGGRMIALKDDPIWSEISRFERPWPPFDFGSGMGVRDVDRDEAEALGLLAPGQEISSPQESFNKSLSASVAGMSGEAREILNAALGGRVRFDGADTATFAA